MEKFLTEYIEDEEEKARFKSVIAEMKMVV